MKIIFFLIKPEFLIIFDEKIKKFQLFVFFFEKKIEKSKI